MSTVLARIAAEMGVSRCPLAPVTVSSSAASRSFATPASSGTRACGSWLSGPTSTTCRRSGSCERSPSTTDDTAATTSFAAPGSHGLASQASYASATAPPRVGWPSTGATTPFTDSSPASRASSAATSWTRSALESDAMRMGFQRISVCGAPDRGIVVGQRSAGCASAGTAWTVRGRLMQGGAAGAGVTVSRSR